MSNEIIFILGGIYSIACACFGGFIAIKLRLGADQSILHPREPQGDAFNIDDVGSPEVPTRTLRSYEPSEEVEELPDENIIFKQNARFRAQLAAEKALEQLKEG